MADSERERLARLEQAYEFVKEEIARIGNDSREIKTLLEANSTRIFDTILNHQAELEKKFIPRKEFAIYMTVAGAVFTIALFLIDKLWK